MNRTELDLVLTFKTPLLGTVPKNKEIYATYIQTKARELDKKKAEEELETIVEVEEKGWTGFHQDEDGLFIYSYMIKGWLKTACEAGMATGTLGKIPAYKKWIDLLVFVEPRRLYFGVEEPDGVEERPLRVMQATGPRVTLVRSDYMNIGRQISCKLVYLTNNKGIDRKMIKLCLEYGQYVGLGQWRGSGGFGQFTHEER